MNDTALVPASGKPLTKQQQDFLVQCGLEGDWHVAADQVGATRRQVRGWFSANPTFKQKYDELFDSEELKTTMREIQMASGELGSLYADAMAAEMSKKVMVDCPNCSAKFPIFVKVMDWVTKLKAGDTLLKVTGLWKDEKTVKNETKGSVSIVHMEIADMMALKRLEMGLDIPPHVKARLIRMGALDDDGRSASVTVDGESRSLD